ncbi:hypothetical protein FisN_4Hh381 [Fistulifera solaris]|uniref:Uncharacterized protein n=1 Tax=Fistulifera solaris TaxID=1519565 RepID=A0A1Z5KR88_FISSO|nr:hypothetical protein FisN_4Hh381 [Fistulifera solaris]|eukprot:GAX28428.1 hypothetical protein FisN_4Hh381 [Fistulifera solaris]
MVAASRIASILLFFCLGHALAFSVLNREHRIISRTRLYSDNFSELTNTLARLDQQWKIQQRTKAGASRWKTLRLDSESSATSSGPTSSDPLGALFADSTSKDKVYLLEPPYGSTPSCMILFVGGAGLGTYPQIAYNELLLRLSNRLNAAVLAVPYTIALDHFALAKETGERALQAVSYCQDKFQYPEGLSVYSLSHSLGGKLSIIHYCAMKPEYAGMGIIGFNNFGFGETVRMAREFAQQLQSNIGGPGGNMPPQSDALFNQLFGFAETAVSAMGIDFSPTSSQTYQLIASRFDENIQRKTRLFAMDRDTLHNSAQLSEACSLIDVSGLDGTHLTPVFFELGLDTIPDIDARNMVKDAMGGFEKASYGDEDELNELVQEVCDWIMGKQPKRRPDWKREAPLLNPALVDED